MILISSIEYSEKHNTLKKDLCAIHFPKGTKFYRFINAPPWEVTTGEMRENAGKNGRFNYNQSVYYCSRSMEGLLSEFSFAPIMGSLIVSEAKENICCGQVTSSRLHKIIRGRTESEPAELFHEMILRPFGYDVITDYKSTSSIFDLVCKYYPDGMVYSSVHSLDIYFGGVLFQTDEKCGFCNLALTKEGFSKIIEKDSFVYWYDNNRTR